MEVEKPDQLQEVLGLMAEDYIRNGPQLKRPRGQPATPSWQHSRNSNLEATQKTLQLMANLLIRHDRDLAAIQSQTCYIMFLHSGPDGTIPMILQQSMEWKKKKTPGEGLPLRQHLFVNILTTLVERAQKIHHCKQGDKLLAASLKSPLILGDKSWPFLQWCHQKKELVINRKKPSIPMDGMLQNVTQLLGYCKEEDAVVRFHSFKAQTPQDPVIPRKLDQMVNQLVQSSVWQYGLTADEASQPFPKPPSRCIDDKRATWTAAPQRF